MERSEYRYSIVGGLEYYSAYSAYSAYYLKGRETGLFLYALPSPFPNCHYRGKIDGL